MKMKKITAFIVAILSVLTVASYAPVAKVSAAPTDVKFVHSFTSYSVDYVISKFVKDEVEADGYAYRVQGEAEYGEKITASHTFKGDVSKIYDIEIYNGENAIAASDWKDGIAHTFTLVKETEESSIYYTFENKTRAEYELSINGDEGKLAGKKLGDSFTYPDLTDILVSDYFEYATLKSNLTLYYCRPTSKSFTSTTSKSFTLSEVGTYSFYVVAKDPTGTAFTVDTEKCVREVGAEGDGWYLKDDVNGTSTLVAPIFSFDFAVVKAPEITIDSKVEQGYIGLTYQDAKEYITIVANNESVKYELYYSATDLSTQSGNEWASEGVEVLTTSESAENVSEDKEIAFNNSTLNFTPIKKGFYYVVVTVADKYGEASAVTYAIEVASEFTEVKYDTQFLKHNWVSIMFLGIALLSLIGIILLIFVKPKEEKEEEVTVVAKK